MATKITTCAACGGPLGCPVDCEDLDDGHAIHRDGFLIGPAVELCHGCGGYENPSCEVLWRRIARRMKAKAAPAAGRA